MFQGILLLLLLLRCVYSHDRRVLSTPVGYSHDTMTNQRPGNKSRGISDDVIGHMALLLIF